MDWDPLGISTKPISSTIFRNIVQFCTARITRRAMRPTIMLQLRLIQNSRPRSSSACGNPCAADAEDAADP